MELLKETHGGRVVDEDEWFFESIRRYEHLFMYDMEAKDGEKALCISVSPSGDRWALLTTHDLGVYASPSSLKPHVLLPKRDAPLIAGIYLEESPHLMVFLTEDSLATPLALWRIGQTDILQRDRDVNITNIKVLHSYKEITLAITHDAVYSIHSESDSKLCSHSSNIVSALSLQDTVLTVLKNDGSVCTDDRLDFQLTLPYLIDDLLLLSANYVFVTLSEKTDKYVLYKKTERLFHLEDTKASNFCLSPNEEYLSYITKENLVIKVLDIKSGGNLIFEHDGHRHPIVSHSWHPKIPRTVYSLDSEKNVHIWKFKV